MLDKLSVQQSAFLKRVSESVVSYDALSEEEKGICKFLKKEGYVDCKTTQVIDKNSAVFKSHREIISATISEGGKKYLANERLSDDRSRFLKVQVDSLNRQVDELKRQADAQANIEDHLKKEADTREKDDKKYFWLGVLFSFVTAMLVEHGLELLQFLQGLFRS